MKIHTLAVLVLVMGTELWAEESCSWKAWKDGIDGGEDKSCKYQCLEGNDCAPGGAQFNGPDILKYDDQKKCTNGDAVAATWNTARNDAYYCAWRCQAYDKFYFYAGGGLCKCYKNDVECIVGEGGGPGVGIFHLKTTVSTTAAPLTTPARPLTTTGVIDDAESHEGCAMSYMGKCSAFLPTDKPDNLIEEVGHVESVQVCQHICKELYPDWCTWFIYDRTTNDCKVFNGTIDSFREDCQELGYQKEPSTEHCDVLYEPEEKNSCYNFREDYCRYDGSLLDTLEKIETLSKCQMACQFINGCIYFQYDKQEKICKLHTDLVATRVCDMVHGTPEPDFQTCLDDGNVPWDADHAEHGEDRSILGI